MSLITCPEELLITWINLLVFQPPKRHFKILLKLMSDYFSLARIHLRVSLLEHLNEFSLFILEQHHFPSISNYLN